MANNAGIKKAQNNVFGQDDSAISGRMSGAIFDYGSVSQPGFNPTPGNFFWYGTGNQNIGSNITLSAKGTVETALSITVALFCPVMFPCGWAGRRGHVGCIV